MNLETTQDMLNANLSIKAMANAFNGARYCNDDIGKLNMQFDLEWESHHGYHPIEAADWERGFNLREGA